MSKHNWKCWSFGHRWRYIPSVIGAGFMQCIRCGIIEVEEP